MKTSKYPAIGISIFLFCCLGYAKPSANIRSAILAEVKKYPNLEIQDLYKLAYQASMGNEHIMFDTIQAWKYLKEELASIDSSSSEPLLELLRSDSAIARINLRVFKAQQGNPDKLFSMMVLTASNLKPSFALLKSFWNDIEILADEGKIPFKKIDLRSYFEDMEMNKFPVVHHSKIVKEKYKPAYRIINGATVAIN